MYIYKHVHTHRHTHTEVLLVKMLDWFSDNTTSVQYVSVDFFLNWAVGS